MTAFRLALADTLQWVFMAYYWIIIASAVTSWVQADPSNPIVHFLRAVTEPVFRWFRQRLPFLVMGAVDLSPMAVLMILYFLDRVLVYQIRIWGMP